MFVVGRIALSIVCLGLLVGSASAATPVKPADHHGYRWGAQKLLCTSVRKERRPADKVVIHYRGKTYYCSKPAPKVPAGSPALAAEAMGAAIQDRFVPGSSYRWQVALPGCTGGAGRYACQVDVPQLKATANVTWSAAGPKVTFTSFVCGPEYAGRAGC